MNVKRGRILGKQYQLNIIEVCNPFFNARRIS